MSRFNQIKMISQRQMDDINSFLSELKDEDAYRSRLEKIEGLKAEVNAAIEVYGKANDIDRLHSEAAQRNASALKVNQDAVVIRSDAKAEADKLIEASKSKIDTSEREANQRWNERERLLRDGESNLGIREKALAKANDDLIRRELQAAADLSSALDIRTAYTEAVASLKKAIEDTAKAL